MQSATSSKFYDPDMSVENEYEAQSHDEYLTEQLSNSLIHMVNVLQLCARDKRAMELLLLHYNENERFTDTQDIVAKGIINDWPITQIMEELETKAWGSVQRAGRTRRKNTGNKSIFPTCRDMINSYKECRDEFQALSAIEPDERTSEQANRYFFLEKELEFLGSVQSLAHKHKRKRS